MPFNDLYTQLKRQSVERALSEPAPRADWLNPGRTLSQKEQFEQARKQLKGQPAQMPATPKKSPLDRIGTIKGALDRIKGR